jgi:hypothetical protein
MCQLNSVTRLSTFAGYAIQLGRNMLAQILMQVRAELSDDQR